MLRMMSQRVVNLSNDSDMIEQSIRRKASVKSARLEGPPTLPAMTDYAHDGPVAQPIDSEMPLEKVPSVQQFPVHDLPPTALTKHTNPLRGKALGIFGPESRLRKSLCEVLVHPVTEPIILILIIFQTVLLAVGAAPSVYNHPRTDRNGISKIDYALLVLFVLYTIEVISRMV